MEYNFVIKNFGRLLDGMIAKELNDKALVKKINEEYKAIMLRAKDIGKDNIFTTSYAMGAYYLAMVRRDNLSPKENQILLSNAISKSKVFKLFLGSADSYLSEKNMAKRKKIAKASKLHKYENDWVWDIVDKDENYDGGYDYYECGVCKLFKDEGAFELAKYVCKLDFPMFNMIGIDLYRSKTIADGCDKCDFRFKKQSKK